MSFDPGPAATVLHRARLDRAMVGRLAVAIAPATIRVEFAGLAPVELALV